MEDLLTPATVGAHLARRGLAADPAAVRAVPLGGGVSNVVLACRTAGEEGRRLVVKQSLARLRTADEWHAPRRRLLDEARALRLTARLTPGAVPEVLDVDADACVLVLEHAPGGWADWKSALLRGEADPAVAAHTGDVLGRWHAATGPGGELHCEAADFGHASFAALRLDPYHRTVAARRPEWAPLLAPYTDALADNHTALVHGDLSPKNVLTGPGGTWVIDHEVAHLGDPAFDLAFLLHHLLLKSVHRPGSATSYRACARAFLLTYRAHVHRPAEGAEISGHTACLLLARTDGRSPAEYLDEGGREAVRRLALAALHDPPPDPHDLWALLPAPPPPPPPNGAAP